MKHVGKTLIIAGALSLSGIVFLSIGSHMLYSEQKNENNKKYEQKQYTAKVSEIKTIKTDLSSDNISIEPGQGDSIEITYDDKTDDPEYEISEKNGTLKITHKPEFSFFLFQIPDLSFIWNSEDTQIITVKVPKDYAGTYDLYLGSGTISVSDLEIKETLKADATSGTIRLDTLICRKDVSVEISSGNLTMDHVNVQGNMDCRSTSGHANVSDITVNGDWSILISSGSIDMTNADVNGALKADLTSGKIIAKAVSTAEVFSEISSGSINFDELSVDKGISASATSGKIIVSLTDDINNYKINSDVTSGHSNLPDHFGNGNKYIDVNISSGNINFSFTE